jgi:hypothetical protein
VGEYRKAGESRPYLDKTRVKKLETMRKTFDLNGFC